MKKIIENIGKDKPLLTGLIFLFISAILYGITLSEYQNQRDIFTPLFFIHYGFAVLYFFYLIAWKELRLNQLFSGKSFPYHLLLLILLNISAYSLNQKTPVFNESVSWLTAFLILENSLLLVYILVPSLNKTFASLLLFFFTFALLFNIYQVLMVFPYMAVGLVASPFLGISLHVLVPIAYVVAFLFIMKDLIQKGANWVSFAVACSCCSILLGFYIVQWNNVNKAITKTVHQQLIPGAVKELPVWVRLAQFLPDNSFTENALKSGLIYQEASQWNNWFGEGLRFEETKFHDPLISIASFGGGKIELDNETKIKILDAKYNMRHESADRFWSGLNLKTSDIITNVELFPSYRLAYTEMILRIRNEAYDQGSSWFGQEEALYTFQLPEGGTVSSLSLWIEGTEAKARLTTKSKAEKAYNTIVGREMRDPSVVYWMEGNKIRVRIFPCTPKEDRQFKIGITSPLANTGDHLIYRNIGFKGPDFDEAKASVNVLVQEKAGVSESTITQAFELEKNGDTYSWTGSYRSNWSITTPKPPLSNESFFFQGNAYSVAELSPVNIDFKPESVYLDLHAGWGANEIKEIAGLFQNTEFKVYDYNSGKWQRLHINEILEILDRELAPQFSLFPFHKVTNAEQSLVISKGNRATPNLSDIHESTFNEDLFNHLCHSASIKVFDLHNQPSDFIRSLQEFKVIEYAQGSVNELGKYLKKGKFPAVPIQENAISIPAAGITIRRAPAKAQLTNAPDHLLRLFSYNQVLKSIGKNYFNNDYLQEEIIKEAALGNVVTPISSLIVLETLKDYKRFEIDENKDSLGNAEINASGAVPEPHEWALIILGALFISWMWLSKKRKSYSI